MVDESAKKLRCHSIWTAPGTAVDTYGAASRELTFLCGIGLPGRVWADTKPVWISDVTHDQNFPRAALAEQAGLHTATAFPVKLAGRVYAVLEFFHHEILPEDPSMLMVFQAVADQLSQFCARKRAEEALQASELRLRCTLDVATDGLWDWNLSTKQAYYSPSWIRLLGLEDQDIPLNNIHDWKSRIHAEDLPWVEQALNEHLEGNTANYIIEHRVRHRSGDWKWFAMRGKLVQWDEQSRPLRMMGTMTDITERKVSESALAQAAQDLGKKNFELAEARDKALDAAKMKAEFLATMSHEIQTPMNGVIGMTGLLLDTPLSSEQREFAETVRRSGEHLLDIINDILDFSKVEAGKLELEGLDFDLRTTVEDAISLISERAYSKGLELAYLVQAGVPTALPAAFDRS